MQQKMLSDQPLAASAQAKRKRNKYVGTKRPKHVQKPVQDMWPRTCTEVLCRSLLAGLCGGWPQYLCLAIFMLSAGAGRGFVFCISSKQAGSVNLAAAGLLCSTADSILKIMLAYRFRAAWVRAAAVHQK